MAQGPDPAPRTPCQTCTDPLGYGLMGRRMNGDWGPQLGASQPFCSVEQLLWWSGLGIWSGTYVPHQCLLLLQVGDNYHPGEHKWQRVAWVLQWERALGRKGKGRAGAWMGGYYWGLRQLWSVRVSCGLLEKGWVSFSVWILSGGRNLSWEASGKWGGSEVGTGTLIGIGNSNTVVAFFSTLNKANMGVGKEEVVGCEEVTTCWPNTMQRTATSAIM